MVVGWFHSSARDWRIVVYFIFQGEHHHPNSEHKEPQPQLYGHPEFSIFFSIRLTKKSLEIGMRLLASGIAVDHSDILTSTVCLFRLQMCVFREPETDMFWPLVKQFTFHGSFKCILLPMKSIPKRTRTMFSWRFKTHSVLVPTPFDPIRFLVVGIYFLIRFVVVSWSVADSLLSFHYFPLYQLPVYIHMHIAFHFHFSFL